MQGSRKHFCANGMQTVQNRTLRRMRVVLFFGLKRNCQIVHSKGHAALSCFLQLWLPMHGCLSKMVLLPYEQYVPLLSQS